MNTITIPRSLIKNDDLVVIPRKEYNSLLELKKVIAIVKATKSELAAVKRGEREIKRGDFAFWSKLKHDLAHSSS